MTPAIKSSAAMENTDALMYFIGYLEGVGIEGVEAQQVKTIKGTFRTGFLNKIYRHTVSE